MDETLKFRPRRTIVDPAMEFLHPHVHIDYLEIPLIYYDSYQKYIFNFFL